MGDGHLRLPRRSNRLLRFKEWCSCSDAYGSEGPPSAAVSVGGGDGLAVALGTSVVPRTRRRGEPQRRCVIYCCFSVLVRLRLGLRLGFWIRLGLRLGFWLRLRFWFRLRVGFWLWLGFGLRLRPRFAPTRSVIVVIIRGNSRNAFVRESLEERKQAAEVRYPVVRDSAAGRSHRTFIAVHLVLKRERNVRIERLAPDGFSWRILRDVRIRDASRPISICQSGTRQKRPSSGECPKGTDMLHRLRHGRPPYSSNLWPVSPTLIATTPVPAFAYTKPAETQQAWREVKPNVAILTPIWPRCAKSIRFQRYHAQPNTPCKAPMPRASCRTLSQDGVYASSAPVQTSRGEVRSAICCRCFGVPQCRRIGNPMELAPFPRHCMRGDWPTT